MDLHQPFDPGLRKLRFTEAQMLTVEFTWELILVLSECYLKACQLRSRQPLRACVPHKALEWQPGATIPKFA